MKSTRILFLIIFSAVLYGCSSPKQEPSSFITTLGNDTLVIEQFIMEPERVEAEVLIRSPRTRYIKQTLLMESDGSFKEFSSTTHAPDDLSGPALEEQQIDVVGDSLVVTYRRDTTVRTMSYAFDPALIPWFDMVHWPYEVATRYMVKYGRDSLSQPMLTGRRPAEFEIWKLEEDSVAIKHPYRGTMYATIDKHGALLHYDATATTRKLIVNRGGPVDMAALAARYADKPIGSLSGEGKTETSVHDASILITFGQPARRGRDLFGGIVPWNEVWRTGANRATHFSTDKDLIFGDLLVPAGEYTLFTIPEPDGGTLIINQQTGQNGNNYDKSLDLGRVPMTRAENDESVELFTIDAVELEDKGILQLKWGTTVFEVGFEVAD